MTVKKGDKIEVDYTGKFEDGTVFDTSTHGNHSHPLAFEAGAKQVIKGFDDAVIGMEVGDEKTITIKSEEGYGEHNPEMIKEFSKEKVPDADKIKEGMTLGIGLPNGQQMPVVVKEVKEDVIMLDMNHPLAGKTLNFEIKIVSINKE